MSHILLNSVFIPFMEQTEKMKKVVRSFISAHEQHHSVDLHKTVTNELSMSV